MEIIKKKLIFMPYINVFDEFKKNVDDNIKYIILASTICVDEVLKYPTRCLLSDIHIINIFKNKQFFYNYIQQLGYEDNIPTQYYLNSETIYPCVYKEFSNSAGVRTYIVNSQKDLNILIKKRKKKCNGKYLLQEIIEGPVEYSSIFLSYNGKVECELHMKYVYAKDMYVFPRVRCLKKESLNHVNYDKTIFYKIIEQSNFHGLCNFNYKIKDGRIVIFESNPRLGADIVDHPIDKQIGLIQKYMDLVDKMNGSI